MKSKMPGYYAKNIAVNATRRVMAKKKAQSTDPAGDNRQAAANVIMMCALAALYDKYHIGAERLNRVVNCANEQADAFAADVAVRGGDKARERLREKSAELLPEGFLLPAGRAPKNDNEKALLYERRDAAEIVMRAYALAMRQALNFGPARIETVIQETRGNYLQFLDYAKDGDYYGYELLRRKMEQILNEDVTLVEEKGKAPVFSDRII